MKYLDFPKTRAFLIVFDAKKSHGSKMKILGNFRKIFGPGKLFRPYVRPVSITISIFSNNF
jgi:hypothetical protein